MAHLSQTPPESDPTLQMDTLTAEMRPSNCGDCTMKLPSGRVAVPVLFPRTYQGPRRHKVHGGRLTRVDVSNNKATYFKYSEKAGRKSTHGLRLCSCRSWGCL